MKAAQRASLLRDEAGVVSVEFLLVFFPLFTFFFGIVQYGLLVGARVVVEHAAVCAARAASVVLPDDPADYGGESVYSLDGSAASTVESPLESMVRRGALAGPAQISTQSARFEAIAAAALLPLVAISPFRTKFETHLEDAVFQAGELPYAIQATSLELVLGGQGATLGGANQGPREVTARVTHLVRCNVPLVDKLVCSSDASSTRAGFSQHQLSRSGAPEGAVYQLTGEATMPIQGAAYAYASAGGTP